jgi:uncharacterized protein YjbJ (UPF0337 family)
MGWEQIRGKWAQFKGRARQRWGRLTDDDLAAVDGDKDRLVGKLQERYGYARELAESEVEAFSLTLAADKREVVAGEAGEAVSAGAPRPCRPVFLPARRLRSPVGRSRAGEL